MNRKELVGAVATHTGMEPREVDKVLKGMTEVIEAVAAKGERSPSAASPSSPASAGPLAWPGIPPPARR